MDWSDVTEFIGKAAPVVGTLLGGPAGAAVGGLVASALGVEDDPDKVAKALKVNPKALVKIKELELSHARELRELAIKAAGQRIDAETLRLAQVNQTMRAGLQSDSTYKSGWRPFIGYVFGVSLAAIAGAMVYAIVKDPTVVSDPEFSGMMIWTLVTMASALGLNVHARSKDKAIQAGVSPSGIVDAITNRIRGSA